MPASENLYVGNATRQTFKFMYRVSRDAPIWEVIIPSGTQAKIGNDLAPSQVDHIIRQHAPYGIVAADTIDQAKGFHGLCYSVGKHITQARLTMLMNANHGALVKQGQEIREASAVAQSNMLEQVLVENDRPERLRELEITVQQEEADLKNPEPQFSEGFRVIRPDFTNAPPKKGRSRRAA